MTVPPARGAAAGARFARAIRLGSVVVLGFASGLPLALTGQAMHAWLSASQDVVVDAYRADLLLPAERGIGSSLTVLGYRMAMILSGGIAFIWVDPHQGGGWSWPEVYRVMAIFMVGAAAFSALCAPRLARPVMPSSVAGLA